MSEPDEKKRGTLLAKISLIIGGAWVVALVVEFVFGLTFLTVFNRTDSVTIKSVFGGLSMALGLVMYISILLSPVAVIAGVLALRRLKNNIRCKWFAISGTVLGGLTCAGLIALLCYKLTLAPKHMEIQSIRSVGCVLYQYAYDHDGKFPDSMEKLFQDEEWDKTSPKLYYLPETKELRWIYHPGHTLSEPDAILLETAPAQQEKLKGKAVLRVGLKAEFIKDKR